MMDYFISVVSNNCNPNALFRDSHMIVTSDVREFRNTGLKLRHFQDTKVLFKNCCILEHTRIISVICYVANFFTEIMQ